MGLSRSWQREGDVGQTLLSAEALADPPVCPTSQRQGTTESPRRPGGVGSRCRRASRSRPASPAGRARKVAENHVALSHTFFISSFSEKM